LERRLRENFSPTVTALPADEKIANTLLKNGAPFPVEKNYPDEQAVFVEIPENINAIGLNNPALARTWRENTRAALQHYFNRGYRVTDFVKIATRCFYFLESQ
jgi:predicted GNAT superfamily acetyltransferase